MNPLCPHCYEEFDPKDHDIGYTFLCSCGEALELDWDCVVSDDGDEYCGYYLRIVITGSK